MKLRNLVEYAPTGAPEFRVSQTELTDIVHSFLSVVDEYFRTGEQGWEAHRLTVRGEGIMVPVPIRIGVSHDPDVQLDLQVEPTYEDVEVRLDLHPLLRREVDWEQNRTRFLGTLAASLPSQLEDPIRRLVWAQIKRHRKVTA